MKCKIMALLGLLLINASWLHAQLKISTGGTFYINGATVSLNDIPISNDGNLANTSSSTIVFGGTKDDNLNSTGLTDFYGLTINKSGSAKVYLQTDIKVKGALTMNAGKLDLGNNNAELVYPSGLVISETENNRIMSSGTGEIYITQTLNNPFGIKPGNLGAVITSSKNLGATTIRRGHQVQNNVNGGQSIARYYKITPAANSNLNASLQFTYLDAELNNISESALGLYAKPSNTWVLQGKDGADMGKNIVQKNSMASLGFYTLGKGAVTGNLIAANGNSAELSKSMMPDVRLTKEVITIGPNPTMGDLKIMLTLTKASTMNVLVTDAGGKPLLQKQWRASAGTSTETIHINSQPSGIYMVKVFSSEGLAQTFRILKQ